MTDRELDALVAENVFGFKTYKTSNPFDYVGSDKNIYTMSQLDEIGHVEETKRYSTSIADAWTVVEKMEDEYEFRIFSPHRRLKDTDWDKWECEITNKTTGAWWTMQADTAPKAICLAALKALDVILD